jgi:hypothetical protein
MSASLEDVPRGDSELAEVTSLEQAVRVWAGLDRELQSRARLAPDRPIDLNGAMTAMFTGQAIAMLVTRLPPAHTA